jgi:hypothetical protein
MTDHAHTLATFLQTDLYRLEAALEAQAWTDTTRSRLTDHLQRLKQVVALVTGHPTPTIPPLSSMEDALETLHSLTDNVRTTIAALPPHRLDALVLDPYERNLTLLAHLYDYARLSAMLVEWSQHLTPPPTLDAWFQEPEE